MSWRSALMTACRGYGGGALVRRSLSKQRLRSASSDEAHTSSHGGGGGGWFSPGDRDPGGYLFNETPPPPGQSRKWEDWELPYYATGVIAFLMLSIGLTSKPNTNIDVWAHKVALRRLQEEEEAAEAANAVEDAHAADQVEGSAVLSAAHD
jgi:hypothetical protein